MRRFIAILLFVPGMAGAVCFQHPDTGQIICDDPQLCPNGWQWSRQTQRCEPPKLVPFCEVKISYPDNDPSKAVASVPEFCDRASAELAVAMALAKLLGAP